jgi:small subunit ribosomal protein S3
MGQKVNPIAYRTGVTTGWKSRWYAPKQEFATLLLEDMKVRKFVKKHPTKNYAAAGIDHIEIDRTRDEVRVTLFVARPGLIIGKKGQEVEVLQNEIQNLIGRRVNLRIEEIKRADLHAQLVAEKIAEQLAKSVEFPSDHETSHGRDDEVWAPRESRFNWRADWAARKWRGEKNQMWAPFL